MSKLRPAVAARLATWIATLATRYLHRIADIGVGVGDRDRTGDLTVAATLTGGTTELTVMVLSELFIGRDKDRDHVGQSTGTWAGKAKPEFFPCWKGPEPVPAAWPLDEQKGTPKAKFSH